MTHGEDATAERCGEPGHLDAPGDDGRRRGR
jgi:hypothetical protein